MGDYQKKMKQFTSEYGDFFTLLTIYRLYQKEQNDIINLNKLEKQNVQQSVQQSIQSGGNNNNNTILKSVNASKNMPKRTTRKWCKERYLND